MTFFVEVDYNNTLEMLISSTPQKASSSWRNTLMIGQCQPKKKKKDCQKKPNIIKGLFAQNTIIPKITCRCREIRVKVRDWKPSFN